MARKLRIQFPGAIYHVMSRGNRREDIFRDDDDRGAFLKALGDVCVKTGWRIHAYCMMPNHFHLVVETPQPNLVEGMKWFLGTYTARFNRRHKVTGHVFSGRYKSLVVGGEGGYLRTVCDYVHLNPARAKLLPPDAPLHGYHWSSLPMFLAATAQRPEWLQVARVFGECGIPQDSPAGRREFGRRLEARRDQESTEQLEGIRRGWCFGDDDFRKELLGQMDSKFGKSHYGSEVHEAAEARANRIVTEELGIAKWTERELNARRKGDPAKLVIARRLRAETTMTLQWIATRLHMGAKTHLSHLLYWKQRDEKAGKSVVRSKTASTRSTPKKRQPSEPSPVQASPARVNSSESEKSIPGTDPIGFDVSFD